MTYQAALDYLAGFQRFGMRPGLENTRWLAAQLGQPHDRLAFIHVAGTNGKGSVCAFLEAIHREAGRHVGLFTSPHLISFTERIQLNREPISQSAVAHGIHQLQPLISGSNREFTFFEVVTVLALGYFAEKQCDVVIWETGLGGRLDSTNIVTPMASVITNIDLDHQQWLGTTFDAIAAEKAGIIKPGRPVTTAAKLGRGLEVIVRKAHELHCPTTVIASNAQEVKAIQSALPELSGLGKVWTEEEAWNVAGGETAGPWSAVHLGLQGMHQRVNAALASATVATLAQQLPVSTHALQAGLATVSWPGRLQLIRVRAGQSILLDGAHNPASARALREAIADGFPNVRLTLILGVLSDKDWRSVVEILAPLAKKIVTLSVSSQRTLPPETLATECHRVNPAAEVTTRPGLGQALDETTGDPFVLIAGSLYLIGEALERLHRAPEDVRSERGLNEWGGVPR